MKNWDSTKKVLVQLRKMSRGDVYPVELNEKSETEWEAVVSCDSGAEYKFFPKYFEKYCDKKSIFKIEYENIKEQFFQKEDDLRKWAKEEHGLDLDKEGRRAKELYFGKYQIFTRSGEIYECKGSASWPVYEAIKTLQWRKT